MSRRWVKFRIWRTPGAAIADMDSTAIQIECIGMKSLLAGTGEKVAEVTSARCAAEFDFTPACAAAWRRWRDAIFCAVRGNLPLMPH